jgi:hypothetical protein
MQLIRLDPSIILIGLKSHYGLITQKEVWTSFGPVVIFSTRVGSSGIILMVSG